MLHRLIVMLSFGIALVYAGNFHLFYSAMTYLYKSHGIVFDGESKEIFRRPNQLIPKSADREEVNRFLDSIMARVDELYLQGSEFRGIMFNVEADGGSRTYYLENKTEMDPWQSQLVVFVGVVMLISGSTGIFLEKKLSRYP
jgi:hypothetical protein